MQRNKKNISFTGFGKFTVETEKYTNAIGEKLVKDFSCTVKENIISFLLEKGLIKANELGELVISKAKKVIIEDSSDYLDESTIPYAETVFQKGGILDGSIKGFDIVLSGGKNGGIKPDNSLLLTGDYSLDPSIKLIPKDLYLDGTANIPQNADVTVNGKTSLYGNSHILGKIHTNNMEFHDYSYLEEGAQAVVNDYNDVTLEYRAKIKGKLDIKNGNLNLKDWSSLEPKSNVAVNGKTNFEKETTAKGNLSTKGLTFPGFDYTFSESSTINFMEPIWLNGFSTNGKILAKSSDLKNPFITLQSSILGETSSANIEGRILLSSDSKILSKNTDVDKCFKASILDLVDGSSIDSHAYINVDEANIDITDVPLKGNINVNNSLKITGKDAVYQEPVIDKEAIINVGNNLSLGGEVKNQGNITTNTASLVGNIENSGTITTNNLIIKTEDPTQKFCVKNNGIINVKENATINNKLLNEKGGQLNIEKDLSMSREALFTEPGSIMNLGTKYNSNETKSFNIVRAYCDGDINVIGEKNLHLKDCVVTGGVPPTIITNKTGNTYLEDQSRLENVILDTNNLYITDAYTGENSKILVSGSATISRIAGKPQVIDGLIELTSGGASLLATENVTLGGKINAVKGVKVDLRGVTVDGNIDANQLIADSSNFGATSTLKCKSLTLNNKSTNYGANISTETLDVNGGSELHSISGSQVIVTSKANFDNSTNDGILKVIPKANDGNDATERLVLNNGSNLGESSRVTVEGGLTRTDNPLPLPGFVSRISGSLSVSNLNLRNTIITDKASVDVKNNAVMEVSENQSKHFIVGNMLSLGKNTLLDIGSYTKTHIARLCSPNVDIKTKDFYYDILEYDYTKSSKSKPLSSNQIQKTMQIKKPKIDKPPKGNMKI